MAPPSAPATSDRHHPKASYHSGIAWLTQQGCNTCLLSLRLVVWVKRYSGRRPTSSDFLFLLVTWLPLFFHHQHSSFEYSALHTDANDIVFDIAINHCCYPRRQRHHWDPGISQYHRVRVHVENECTRTATGSIVTLVDEQSFSLPRANNPSNPVIECCLYSSPSSTTSRRYSPISWAVAEPWPTTRTCPLSTSASLTANNKSLNPIHQPTATCLRRVIEPLILFKSKLPTRFVSSNISKQQLQNYKRCQVLIVDCGRVIDRLIPSLTSAGIATVSNTSPLTFTPTVAMPTLAVKSLKDISVKIKFQPPTPASNRFQVLKISIPIRIFVIAPSTSLSISTATLSTVESNLAVETLATPNSNWCCRVTFALTVPSAAVNSDPIVIAKVIESLIPTATVSSTSPVTVATEAQHQPISAAISFSLTSAATATVSRLDKSQASNLSINPGVRYAYKSITVAVTDSSAIVIMPPTRRQPTRAAQPPQKTPAAPSYAAATTSSLLGGLGYKINSSKHWFILLSKESY